MKKNEFTEIRVNFQSDKKEAQNEVKSASKNIFFWQKNLRTLAKKNEFCEGQSVAKVAKAVRNYTKGGSLFDLCAFEKDAEGRFCTRALASKDSHIITTGEGYCTDEKGRQYIEGSATEILLPVPCTLLGVFNAFCKVATAEIKALEKAEKEAICEEEKALKAEQRAKAKAEKIKVRKLNELQRALDKGILTEAEYNEKAKALNN